MIKYCCNHCGEEDVLYKEYDRGLYEVDVTVEKDALCSNHAGEIFHLCPRCNELLIKFMHPEEV